GDETAASVADHCVHENRCRCCRHRVTLRRRCGLLPDEVHQKDGRRKAEDEKYESKKQRFPADSYFPSSAFRLPSFHDYSTKRKVAVLATLTAPCLTMTRSS